MFVCWNELLSFMFFHLFSCFSFSQKHSTIFERVQKKCVGQLPAMTVWEFIFKFRNRHWSVLNSLRSLSKQITQHRASLASSGEGNSTARGPYKMTITSSQRITQRWTLLCLDFQLWPFSLKFVDLQYETINILDWNINKVMEYRTSIKIDEFQ